MSSREKILEAVRRSQPAELPLPETAAGSPEAGTLQQFRTVLESIGGKAYELKAGEGLIPVINNLFPDARRVVSSEASIERHFLSEYKTVRHHSLQDVDVAIIKAVFAVAENGAVWVTEDELKIRVLPFICEHLVAIIDAHDMVATMRDAYARIGSADYGFGLFIAGPSKTADIEQSLVLGAHGPKSMTVLIRQ